MAVMIPLAASSQIAMVIVAVFFGSISTIAIGLRLVAARIAHRRLDASDYCILLAWLLTLGLTVACILEAVLGGFGWHENDILSRFGPDPIVQYHKIILPLEMLWNLSLTATKLSVLLFYIKIFAVTPVVLPAKIMMVFIALMGMSGFLSTFLICDPFAYNWDLAIPGGHCGSQSALFVVFGLLNLGTDVAVLTMPIPSLLSLRMPVWKKAWLLATFTLGFITCIASIIRLAYLSKIDYNDVTYTSVTAVLMTAVEPSLAVMLACIPLLRPLLGQIRRPDREVESSPKSVGFSAWMSSAWSRSKSFNSSKKRSMVQREKPSGLVRLGSSEAQLGSRNSIMRSAVLRNSRSINTRYDSDDAMELRYVLSPAEGVSHHAHVVSLSRKGSVSVGGDEAIRQQMKDIEAAQPGIGGGGGGGGITIMVKQEWNVEHEPKVPP